MSALDAKAEGVKLRALSGLKALTLRTAFTQVLRLVSSICLARLLMPNDYGVFGVVAYLTGLGLFLGDVGLSAALVRQHREPTPDETCTVFWSQQTLTATVICILLACSGWIIHAYKLSESGSLLLYAMSGGLFFSSLRIVPMMMLERQLRFSTIAKCELIESCALTIGTILLAALHFGPWALAGGALFRGAVGLCCVWAASPWRPSGTFRLSALKELAGFGAAFQLNAIVPSIAAGWVPIIVGRFLGTVALGLMNWATNLASTPLALSVVLNRVAFPAYSRLQHDPVALSTYLVSTVRRLGTVLWLIVPIFVVVCPVVIPIVFGARWTRAIPLTQWFSIECVLLTLTGLTASTQNAIGKAGQRLAVTICVGLLRWGAGAVVALRFHQLPLIALTMCMVSLIELAVTCILVARSLPECRNVPVAIFRPILTVGALLVTALAVGDMVPTHYGLVRCAVSLFVLGIGLIIRELAIDKNLLRTELKALFYMLRPSSNKGAA